MLRKIIFIITLSTICLSSFAQNKSRRSYINRYKYLAVKEMKRTGIPASITLAQGLLESGNGKSTLAKKARNHFGIKCHNDWRGPYIRFDDDRPNEKFRKYKRVEDSYRDHSNFLTQKKRYHFLFNYKRDDYKKWAKGLKKAGYATAKDYADKLITIIEEEKLYNLDNLTSKEVRLLATTQDPKNSLKAKVEIINGRECLIIEKGDTFFAISQQFDVSIRRLHRYNEMKNSDILKINQRIFLKKKKRKSARGYDYHLVKKGESLYKIAQNYGVQIKMLYKYNYLNKGDEPKKGERIYLRKKAPLVVY